MVRTYINRISIGLAICMLAITHTGCTHSFDGSPYDNTPVGNIEALWQIIDQKYCFIEEKGIDWASIHQAYIDSAKLIDTSNKESNIQLFDLMENMLNLLHDGHVNLYTTFDVSGSREWYAGYPTNYDRELINTYYLNNARQAGGLYYNKIDSDRIGYIYYGSFSSGFSSANMYHILSSFKDCRGIVLDVRNNGGGDLNNAYKLAATFMSHDTIVGYWQHKTGPGHTNFSELEPIYIRENDMPQKWFRPVVVLQNRRSYSATNSFLNAMRYADNALLLGGISGGGGGMPLSYELPNGWIVRFSSIKMYNREKQSIEEGIPPHVYDTLKSKDKDDLIEHAVQVIHAAYKDKQP